MTNSAWLEACGRALCRNLKFLKGNTVEDLDPESRDEDGWCYLSTHIPVVLRQSWYVADCHSNLEPYSLVLAENPLCVYLAIRMYVTEFNMFELLEMIKRASTLSSRIRKSRA